MNNLFINLKNDFNEFKKYIKESNNKVKIIIPNLLTFSRIIAPIFILLVTLLGNFPLAVIFASFFALTDALDGFLARKWNVVSDFGKNLDAIADKFFVFGLVIPFITQPTMILTIILEGIISGINLNSVIKNNNPSSTYLGKFKTTLLSLLLAMSYLFKALGINIELLLPLVVITNSIQIMTSIDYLYIDNKKDDLKKEVANKSIIESEVSKTKQDIIEYKHLKESLIEEKNNHENIKKEKQLIR